MTVSGKFNSLQALAAAAAAAVVFMVGMNGAANAQAAAPQAGAMAGIGMHQGRLERRLDAVGATAEQKAQIRAIISKAVTDLADVRAQRRDNRAQIHTLMAQAQIDRTQLEALRVQQMKLADLSSQRWTAALADAAEVLTPEQRAALAKLPHPGWGGPVH